MNKNVVENWKLGVEFVILCAALAFVITNHKLIARLNKA